jgi:hypothetical protein
MSNPQHARVMLDALQGYKQKFGHPAMRALLEQVASVTAASDVPENRMQAVISACVSGKPPAHIPLKTLSRTRSVESIAGTAYARWNAPREQPQE